MTSKNRLFPVVVVGRNLMTENPAVKMNTSPRYWICPGSRISVFLSLMFIIFVGGVVAAKAGNTYNYIGVCPSPNGGKRISDRFGEWECECTSYSADKLNERGVPFFWNYKNVNWRGADNWLNAAKATGTPHSNTPRRGDIAWWASGHVASVDAVDSFGNVSISEYNWGVSHGYHVRTIQKGAASYPNSFIHFPVKF